MKTRQRHLPQARASLGMMLIAIALGTDAGGHEASAQAASVILLSTSADRTCARPSVIRLREDGQIFQIVKESVVINSLGTKNGFANYFGNVHALTIAPGNYTMEFDIFSMQHYYRDNKLLRIRVKPGEVTYVGDAHVEGCQNIKLTITNRWNQVRSKFQETYPKLDLRAVKFELLRRGPEGGPRAERAPRHTA
jgi:hypothetical protein